jgi:surfeit locus 1 family protein
MRVTARGIAAALVVLVVAAVCVRLGFWQLDRLEQRRTRNAAAAEALALPPLELRGAELAAISREPERYVGRRARVVGIYDPAGETVLRGRSHAGRPGVHVVTPLLVEGSDTVVLVNRGWVPSPDGATVDLQPLREPGVHDIVGLLQLVPHAGAESAPTESEVSGARRTTYRRLDLATLEAQLPYPLLPLYVVQLPDASLPELPVRVPAPTLDEGSHLSYAVQWFSFAAIAVIGFLVAVWRRVRAE